MDQFDDIMRGNSSYAAMYQALDVSGVARKGLAILTCIDSRMDPLSILGLEPGDAKIIRNAGARATDDALRSLVLAVNFLGVNRIAVIAHTDCAIASTTNEEVREYLKKQYPKVDTSMTSFATHNDTAATLQHVIDRIHTTRLMPDGIVIVGVIYDV